ncbi:MAG: hypothetical protein PWP25_306 [Sphaerochaeta sp.]|jgi:hypothetical protein|nr:hypothetical protein [Sphaerochaeta sp.]MDN5333607.1 hypothetical protein [Sphaerochaeta sp.]
MHGNRRRKEKTTDFCSMVCRESMLPVGAFFV